jgi:hypothetical protein
MWLSHGINPCNRRRPGTAAAKHSAIIRRPANIRQTCSIRWEGSLTRFSGTVEPLSKAMASQRDSVSLAQRRAYRRASDSRAHDDCLYTRIEGWIAA